MSGRTTFIVAQRLSTAQRPTWSWSWTTAGSSTSGTHDELLEPQLPVRRDRREPARRRPRYRSPREWRHSTRAVRSSGTRRLAAGRWPRTTGLVRHARRSYGGSRATCAPYKRDLSGGGVWVVLVVGRLRRHAGAHRADRRRRDGDRQSRRQCPRAHCCPALSLVASSVFGWLAQRQQISDARHRGPDGALRRCARDRLDKIERSTSATSSRSSPAT